MTSSSVERLHFDAQMLRWHFAHGKALMQSSSAVKSCSLFVETLIDPNSGLAAVCEGEDETSPYHNALAVMVFVHEGKQIQAERILNCFEKHLLADGEHFQGFPHRWSSRTGLPNGRSVPWEGDAAFLLLALDYYQQVFDEQEKYGELKNGLVAFLSQRTRMCELLVAENVAAIYAALSSYTDNRILSRLRQCFYRAEYISGADFANNLWHVILGTLVFGDLGGLRHVQKFLRTEIWDYDGTTQISAYSALSGESFIHVALSVQLLLSWKIWRKELSMDFTDLENNLQKLLLPGQTDPGACGLPERVSNARAKHATRVPALEPTCYWLFYHWGLNPFAGGRK